MFGYSQLCNHSTTHTSSVLSMYKDKFLLRASIRLFGLVLKMMRMEDDDGGGGWRTRSMVDENG